MEVLRISRYSVRIRENTDQNNSKYGHFLRNAFHMVQSADTEFLSIKTQQVLNRPSKCANMRMRHRKNQVFL